MNKIIKKRKVDNEWVLYKLDTNDLWQVIHSGELNDINVLQRAFIDIGFINYP